MSGRHSERIVVTGIGGFVGSHLVKELVHAGFNIFGILHPKERSTRLRSFRRQLTLTRIDVLNAPRIAGYVDEIRPHRIIHLAGWASVGGSFENPVGAFTVNAMGTVNLLEACRNSKPARKALKAIVLVGSSEVYGKVDPDEVPINELKSLQPVSPYGVGKAAADLAGCSYFRAFGLPIIRTRSFNHTGPGQSLGFVVPDFCSSIVEIESSTRRGALRVGNLEAKRDIADVRDVVRAYRLLAEKGTAGEAYNVGSGTARRIGDILGELLSMAKRPIDIRPDPNKIRPAEIPILCADIKKIRDATGWEPVIPWSRTLAETLDFRRSENV